jgi:hypothetical protein
MAEAVQPDGSRPPDAVAATEAVPALDGVNSPLADPVLLSVTVRAAVDPVEAARAGGDRRHPRITGRHADPSRMVTR